MTHRTFPLFFKTLSLYYNAIVLAIIFVSFFSGCHRENQATGPSASKFQIELQSILDRFSSTLVDGVVQGNRKNIQSTVTKLYSGFSKQKEEPFFFVAVLDTHGVTIATKAREELSGTQNYGNYHVVSRVLQKRRPLQSTLYLPEDRKVFIVCYPLIKGRDIAGVLIIGIDSDYLNDLNISENEFKRLTFSARTRTP